MSSSDRYERAMNLFDEVCDLTPSQRTAFLNEACGSDADLIRDVETLLEHDNPEEEKELAAQAGEGLSAMVSAMSKAEAMPVRIGHFRIMRVIGRGGMGVVYEAAQDHPKRSVAVKVLSAASSTSQLLKRFHREANILGLLHHPGIAQVYEAGIGEVQTNDGHLSERPFIAMELVSGLPLDAYVKRNGLAARDRLELFAKVCDAVHYAHEEGVLHRDLKPGNILVESQGQPKVLDFGVARVTNADVNMVTLQTDVGQLVGTVPYMSPEQVSGDPGAIDQRCDVYSLGVVLYELLGERLPLDVTGRPIGEAIRIVQEEDPSRLGSINKLYRGDIETIVAKALEKEKPRRYQTVAALVADIRRHLADEPLVARPASTFYRVRKFTRRNKFLVGGVVATVLSLGVGLIGTAMFALREADARRTSDWSSYRASLAAAAAALRENDVSTAERHLVSTPTTFRGWEWHYLHSQLDESLNSAPIGDRPHNLVYDNLIFGSAHLWFTNAGRTLHLARRDQQNVLVETRAADTLEVTSSWTAENVTMFAPVGAGESLFVQTHDKAPAIHEIRSGATIKAVDPLLGPRKFKLHSGIPDRLLGPLSLDSLGPPDAHLTMGFSKNGRWIIGNVQVSVVRVWAMDESGEIMTLEPHPERMADAVFSPGGRFVATVGFNRALTLFDLESDGRKRWQRADAHDDAPLAVAISPDGRMLASGGQDQVLRLWDARTGAPMGELMGHREPILGIRFHRDGRRVFTCSALTVKSWVLPNRTEPDRMVPHEWYTNAVDVSPDGSLLVTCSRSLRIWDAETGILVTSLGQNASLAHRARFWSDGRHLSILVRGHVLVLDVWTARVVDRLENASAALGSCFDDSGRWLDPASGAALDLRDSSVRRLLMLLPNVSIDERSNRMAYTVTHKDPILVYDLNSFQLLCTLDARFREPLLLFGDGARLATGTSDRGIAIHDVDSGRLLGELYGHTQRIRSLAILPRHDRLLSGSGDRTIRLWDLETMKEVAELRGHLDSIRDLAVTPDEATVFSGSGDYTLRRWDTRPLASRLRARSRYEHIAAQLSPRIDALFGELNGATAVAERVESDDSLSDRERQIALQLVLKEAMSRRSPAEAEQE